jgi:hypothetical protein
MNCYIKDYPTEHTHGLWKHKTRPVWFSLVVDHFGIEYVGHEQAEHLIMREYKSAFNHVLVN